MQYSLDFLFLVLYILADLISFLEIQRLQLAGSSSTVFAANLICNKQRFAYVANECSLQWFISISLINSIWLLSISFFLLAIFNDKATASRCILYGKQGVLLPYQIRIHFSGTTFEMGLYVSFFALNMLYCLLFDKGIMSVC